MGVPVCPAEEDPDEGVRRCEIVVLPKVVDIDLHYPSSLGHQDADVDSNGGRSRFIVSLINNTVKLLSEI